MSVPQLLTLFVCALVLHSATVIQSGPLSSRVDNPDPVPGPALHKRVARSDPWWDWGPAVENPKMTRPVPPPRKRHDGKEDPTTHSTRSSTEQQEQEQQQQQQQQQQLNMIPWYENTSVQVALGLGLLVILLACIIFCLYCSNLLKSKSNKKPRKTPKSGAKSGVKSGQGSTGSRVTSPGTTGQSNESRLGSLPSTGQGTSPGQSNESRLGSLPLSGQGTSPGQSKKSRLESDSKSGPKSGLTSPVSQGTGGKASQSY